jgi:hypothetical protein
MNMKSLFVALTLLLLPSMAFGEVVDFAKAGIHIDFPEGAKWGPLKQLAAEDNHAFWIKSNADRVSLATMFVSKRPEWTYADVISYFRINIVGKDLLTAERGCRWNGFPARQFLIEANRSERKRYISHVVMVNQSWLCVFSISSYAVNPDLDDNYRAFLSSIHPLGSDPAQFLDITKNADQGSDFEALKLRGLPPTSGSVGPVVESPSIAIHPVGQPKIQRVGDKMADVEFVDEPISGVFRALADTYGIDITVPKSVSEKHVTFHLQNVGYREVIDCVVKSLGLDVSEKGRTVTISQALLH